MIAQLNAVNRHIRTAVVFGAAVLLGLSAQAQTAGSGASNSPIAASAPKSSGQIVPIPNLETAAAIGVHASVEAQRVGKVILDELERVKAELESKKSEGRPLSDKDQAQLDQLTKTIGSLKASQSLSPEQIERMVVQSVADLYGSVGAGETRTLAVIMINLIGIDLALLSKVVPLRVPLFRSAGLSGEASLKVGAYIEATSGGGYRVRYDVFVLMSGGGAMAAENEKGFLPKVIPFGFVTVIGSDHIVHEKGKTQSIRELMGWYGEGVVRAIDMYAVTPHFHGALKMSGPKLSWNGYLPEVTGPRVDAFMVTAELGIGRQSSHLVVSGRGLLVFRVSSVGRALYRGMMEKE